MKTLQRILIIVALGLATSSVVNAQGRPGGQRGEGPGGGNGQRPDGARPPRPEPAKVVEHLAEAFALIAPFDVNKDGTLDDAEKATITQAITDGAIKPPTHRTPPAGAKPDSSRMLGRLSEMFGQVVVFDVNKDGKLDDAEQAALKQAIENGDVRGPGGPGGRGGPRGGRAERSENAPRR